MCASCTSGVSLSCVPRVLVMYHCRVCLVYLWCIIVVYASCTCGVSLSCVPCVLVMYHCRTLSDLPGTFQSFDENLSGSWVGEFVEIRTVFH